MGQIRTALLWALILPATVLAGCAEDSEVVAEDPGDVPGVEVTDTTGGIRGVVVDAAIVPVSGADIQLLNTEHTTVTDENGAFAISGLDPGTYFVVASHPLYDVQQAGVEVVAGDETPPIVKIQLNRLIDSEPYANTLQFNGYIFCSMNVVGGYAEECGEGVGVPRSSCFLYNHGNYAPCQANPVMPGERIAKNENNQAGQEWFVDSEGAQTFVIEQFWEPSIQLAVEGGGQFLTFASINWVCDPFCGDDHRFGAFEMASPLYAYIGPEKFENLEVTPETRFTTFTYASENPGILLEQPYEQYVTIGYHLPIPEGWSFVDPAPY